MSKVLSEDHPPAAEDPERAIEHVRLRLMDAASDLRPPPLPTPQELAERLMAVRHNLEEITGDLLLVLHVLQIENAGLQDQLRQVDEKLAEGWRPEASPVEDVVARLRKRIA